MSQHSEPTNASIEEAAGQIREAAAAKKCWGCGCLHGSLDAIERAFPEGKRSKDLDEAVRASRERLSEVRYDCLGCEACFPAIAVNALGIEAVSCPAERVEERQGWPPFPGSYTVLRYQASVAVSTLTDRELAEAIVREAEPEVAIVGTHQTENLGIERLVLNVLSNPHIRFLVLCGPDSRQTIGHLPGQSLVALARSGLDDRSRIIGAKGKRPVLKNISREAVEHFRKTVEVVDLVGEVKVTRILDAARDRAARDPGPAEPFTPERVVKPIPGYVSGRMISDPQGYFVLYVDRARRILSLEHYRNDGVLQTILEGRSAAELYVPAIEKGLLSRLDHAAYLGRELARAEEALRSGGPYIQDAAPERRAAPPASGCGCGSSCERGRS